MYGVWLIPAKEFLTPLAKCINNNSFIANRPSFVPHMTLFASEKDIFKNLKDQLQQLDLNNITLDVECIVKDKTSFYMNYYLKLAKNDQLEKLFNNIKKLDCKSNYQLRPHISLAYGAKSHNEFLEYSFSKEIIFDEIAIMKCSLTESDKSILDFNVLATYNLQTHKYFEY
jgi:2'-5' RNA ligase